MEPNAGKQSTVDPVALSHGEREREFLRIEAPLSLVRSVAAGTCFDKVNFLEVESWENLLSSSKSKRLEYVAIANYKNWAFAASPIIKGKSSPTKLHPYSCVTSAISRQSNWPKPKSELKPIRNVSRRKIESWWKPRKKGNSQFLVRGQSFWEKSSEFESNSGKTIF